MKEIWRPNIFKYSYGEDQLNLKNFCDIMTTQVMRKMYEY